MKKLFFLLAIFTRFDATGQNENYVSVASTEQITWDRYIPPSSRFVMGGEAHTVSCIYPFQLSQIKYLVTKGFRNLVWEVPYSFGYVAQQYISTGNDSLLRFIAWANEDLSYWKSVYELNKTLPEGDKLKIWGIDFELGDISGGEYNKKIFVKAIELMVHGKGRLPRVLQQPFFSLKPDTTTSAVTKSKIQLQQLLTDPEVASFFGEDLPHFKVLINRLDHYKVNRNDEMLEAFNEICSSFHLDSSAKFLGRFGWGHTNKSYKSSMAWLLENHPSSPVKSSVFVIGVQYLNCGLTFRRTDHMDNDGIVYDRKQKNVLAVLNANDPAPIKVFTRDGNENLRKWTKSADILFVFSGFPGCTPLKKSTISQAQNIESKLPAKKQ